MAFFLQISLENIFTRDETEKLEVPYTLFLKAWSMSAFKKQSNWEKRARMGEK